MVSFCAYDNINMGIHNMVTLPEDVVEPTFNNFKDFILNVEPIN